MDRKKVAERVMEILNGRDTVPCELTLSVTNKCNLACLHCITRGRPPYEPEKELTKEQYLRIIREAKELGVKKVDICGNGEPFSEPDKIMAIMRCVKENGLEGGISTNGTLLTERMIEEMVLIGWDDIRFSINGPDRETDDYLRGVKGAYDLTIKSLRLFKEMKESYGSNKPTIAFTPVITSVNHDKISELVNLAKQYGVGSITLQPFMTDILKDRSLTKEEREPIRDKLVLKEEHLKNLRSNLKDASRLAAEFGIRGDFTFLSMSTADAKTDTLIRSDSEKEQDSILSIPCYQPWQRIDIYVDGKVRPCTGAESNPFESIHENTLKEIWNSHSFSSFRQKVASNNLPKCCRTCCPISVEDNRVIRSHLRDMIQTNS